MRDRLTARALGFAGLIPFYGFLAGFAWSKDYPQAFSVQGFVTYSLAIFCFLAGSLWGHARQRHDAGVPLRLVVSNGLVLFAVASMLTAQAMLAALLLMLGYIALLWYERRVDGTEGWYPQMRWQLTLGVVVAHLLYAGLHVYSS